MHIGLNELVEAFVLSVQVIGCQVEPVHVFLAAGDICRWLVVGGSANLGHGAAEGIGTATSVVEGTTDVIDCIVSTAFSLA